MARGSIERSGKHEDARSGSVLLDALLAVAVLATAVPLVNAALSHQLDTAGKRHEAVLRTIERENRITENLLAFPLSAETGRLDE